MKILHLPKFFKHSGEIVLNARCAGFGPAKVISPSNHPYFDPQDPTKYFKPDRDFLNADKCYMWRGSCEFSNLEKKIQGLVDNSIIKYIKQEEIEDLGQYSIDYISVLKYEVGGFFGLHQDSVYTRSSKFKSLSIIVYLSDFEGGELVFPDQGVDILPKKGDVIIFPTGPLFKHYAKEVTKGTKLAMTLWPLVDKQLKITQLSNTSL